MDQPVKDHYLLNNVVGHVANYIISSQVSTVSARNAWDHHPPPPPQCAKKAVSDSPGLVDCAIGLANSVFNLPDRQVMFFAKFE